MSSDLNSVSNWLFANKLTLNTVKSEFMLIGSSQRLNILESNNENEFTININDNEIKRKTSTKCLGVYVDEHLTWHSHIEHIARKVSSGLFSLRKLRSILPQELLVTIYS